MGICPRTGKQIKSVKISHKTEISATQLYVDVRNRKRDPVYIHPDLEEILAETHSVVAYQEQLMAILVKFCGYSLEESDQIRSAIAKKKHDVMTKAFERVRENTGKLGWTPEQSQGVCNVLTAYSNYSFNLSHSYCVSANQKIQTSIGNVSISDITSEHEVLYIDELGNKKKENPTNVWCSGTKEVFEVEFEDGSKIQLTSDHRVWYNSEWVQLKYAIDHGGEWSLIENEEETYMPLRG